MIREVSYIEIVWLAFFRGPKNFCEVFVTEYKWQKPRFTQTRVDEGLIVLHLQ